MKLLDDKKKSRAILNITPLIDVLFILIIFFAVSSTFLEQPGIKLSLPEAQKSEPQIIEKAVLYISSEQKLVFQNEDISLENLGAALLEAMPATSDQSLIVNADKQVPHGFVVKIMDVAKQNGVKKLVIAVDPK